MTLELHMHPLSSYCHKVLIALYENETPFTAHTVNLGDAAGRAAHDKLYALGKIPVLVDKARNRTVPETTIILEYLDRHYPGPRRLFPADPGACLDARLWDRILDCYLHTSMQKIVDDSLRPEADRDPLGVRQAEATLQKIYAMLEERLQGNQWIGGQEFGVADCAAFPALFYACCAVSFRDGKHPRLVSYFEHLVARPSIGKLLEEAKPFFLYFPLHQKLDERFR